jgi:hypothetical protein
MHKIMRLSILFVSLLAFLFVFSPFDAQAKIRFPDTCIAIPGCGMIVPPATSYCPPSGLAGIITDKDSDPIKDAEFTFIHAPIDTPKYPDRIEISGYLEPEFACFNFPGHNPMDPKFVKNVERYEMPCDRGSKQTTGPISIGITVNSIGVPAGFFPEIPPASITIFKDTIPMGIKINSCSKTFRYKGPFLNSGPNDVPPVNSKSLYELKIQNRTNRTYFYVKIDKEFFFTQTLINAYANLVPPFNVSKAMLATTQCSFDLCNVPPPPIPPTSVCESGPPGPCCGNIIPMGNPGAGDFECSVYLDFIQSITTFDIDIQVGEQTWSAFGVPIDLNKLTCCGNVNKQELDFK